jgi:hypothetical protein
VAKKTISNRPYMNGAEARLCKLQERLEIVERNLGKASQDLKFVERGLDELKLVKRDLEGAIEDVRQIRTPAQPENWRLLAANDIEFMKEFFLRVEEPLLILALQDLGGPILAKIMRAIDRSRGQGQG